MIGMIFNFEKMNINILLEEYKENRIQIIISASDFTVINHY